MSIKIITGMAPKVEVKSFRIAVSQEDYDLREWQIRQSAQIPEEAELITTQSYGHNMLDMHYHWYETTIA